MNLLFQISINVRVHARARTNRHVCVWGARERDFFHKMQTATCWILKCYYHKNRHFIEPIAYSICSWFEFLNFVGVFAFFRIHSLLCYCKMLQFKLFNVHLAAFFENDFSILFLTRRRLFGNITKCWEKKEYLNHSWKSICHTENGDPRNFWILNFFSTERISWMFVFFFSNTDYHL